MADIDRDKELVGQADIRKQVLKLGESVEKGFEKQNPRAEKNLDFWDIYYSMLSEKQFYNGTSQVSVPFIHDAVEARKTRFSNQLFPQTGRCVEATTENGENPHATVALLEHYIRMLKLKTQIVNPLLVNGDVEGHYHIYVGWEEDTRTVTRRVQKPVEVEGMELPTDVEEPYDDMEDEDVVDSGPTVEVLSDNDVLVLPPNARDIDHAIRINGAVAILRRWTKQEVKARLARKEISGSMAEHLDELMGQKDIERYNADKIKASAAGVRLEKGDKIAFVFEIWARLKVGKETRLCRIFYAGKDALLSVKLCPYWCDKVPLISAPVTKVAGVFKGISQLDAVLDYQIAANDTLNEGLDSGHFSAMPIIMTDPQKNPKYGSLVLSMAAIWPVDPASTQFAEFPDMWRNLSERLLEFRAQIFQTLSVNPSMIPGTTGGRNKKNQAETAQEQQVDMLMTAESVEVVEENILTPLLTRILEYDHQFRDTAVLIRSYGEVGRQVVMEQIEPQQINRRYEFTWYGVEGARNAAQLQQQIAGLNVIRSIPPQQYPGYKLNIAPALVQLVQNLFGPRLGPLIFSEEQAISVDPMIENDMMEHGFDTPVHPSDDDMQHVQAHMQAMQQTQDPHGTLRKHLMAHQKQLQAKAMAQQHAVSGPQQGGGGAPGAGPAPGGQPSGPQSQPGAPGQIPQDQMGRAGAVVMPGR
jgi:hypothetical protein